MADSDTGLPRGTAQIFAGSSELARVMRAVDWSRTELGPVERWPESVRSAMERCVAHAEEGSAQLRDLEAVLDLLPIGVWRADARCERIVGNRAGYEMLGLPYRMNASLTPGGALPAELERMKFLVEGQEVPPEQLPMQRAALRGESISHVRHEAILPSGEVRVLDANVSPLRDEHGQLSGAIAAYADITNLARTEAALRESEARFRAALDSSAAAFVLLRAVRDDGGRIVDFEWTYANPAAVRMYCLGADAIVGQRVNDVLPAVWDAPGLLELFVRVVECGAPGEIEVELNLNGMSGWFHLIAAKLGDGISVWCTEVTASRRAANESLEARRQLQLVTDLMLAAVARCNADLRYEWVSRSYADRFGLTPADIKGRCIRELLGDATFETLLPRFRDALAGNLVEYEEEMEYPALGRRWIHAAYVPARNASGAVDGWVAVVTDITERKRVQAALEEADRRKDEFLAVLAHELRNPLAPLRNGVHIVRTQLPPDSSLQRTLSMMDRQLTHLVRLVDDLLDVGRINRGKIELRRRRLGLGEVLTAAVESCRGLIESHRHELAVDLWGGEVWVDGDFERLVQVFANLLTNSAKYTERGGRIDLSLVRTKREAIARVRDTGIGIRSEDLDRIFLMFSQLGRDHGKTGLGIGLSLVRSLVTLHGGKVEAASDGPGQGSTFTVRLPLADAPALAAREEPAESGRVTSGRPQRILIADDNTDAAASLAMLLELDGHQVVMARDGIEAVEKVPAFRPELIFMDLGMPRMNGLDASRRIRSLPEGRDVVIVALTGWGQPADRARTKTAGIDLHLVKPVDVAALNEVFATVSALANGGRSPAE